METAYRIVAPPKYAAFQSWDCAICHHEELGHPIFITNGSGVIAAGTGCAAKALGYQHTIGRPSAKITNAMNAEAMRLAQAEEIAAERMTGATAALAAFDGDETDENKSQLERFRSNFWAAKRRGDLPGAAMFRAYLVRASETGEI